MIQKIQDDNLNTIKRKKKCECPEERNSVSEKKWEGLGRFPTRAFIRILSPPSLHLFSKLHPLPFSPACLLSGLIPCQSMFARLSQLSRHLYRPSTFVPAATNPLSSSSFSPLRPSTMTSPAIVNATKTIHTAACLIIGDEVLGGKVSSDMGVKGLPEWKPWTRSELMPHRQLIPTRPSLPNTASNSVSSLSASKSLRMMRAKLSRLSGA